MPAILQAVLARPALRNSSEMLVSHRAVHSVSFAVPGFVPYARVRLSLCPSGVHPSTRRVGVSIWRAGCLMADSLPNS